MKLSDYRKSRQPKVSQEALAKLCGLKSRSVICEIENQTRDAPLRLALVIEKWSDGKVPAASLSKVAAELARKAA